MSLLPTTRINTLSTNNVGASSEPGLGSHGHPGPPEDILLVDFQPVVAVPSSQLLSSPSHTTTTSTAMYQLPPPSGGVGPLGGTHLVGVNNHHPSISSDGKSTPISATGSSGKNNHNNYSLVSLSNHVHNTSREESDLNYHPNLPPPVCPPGAGALSYDENDEFARHQALAQPSYMANKRRSRRFNSRGENHVWDNANHSAIQHAQLQMSSSLSSSEDSDTGFLMGTRKTAYTRKSVQRVVDPHPASTLGGNASPSATTGLLPHLGSRKRVRRKRPSARNRKPVHNQHDKIPNPSDVLSLCCCLCEDDVSAHSNNRSHPRSSIKSRYLRLTCVIVIAIGITVMGSITVGLQKKVESLDWSIKQLDQAVGSPLSSDSLGGANRVTTSAENLENLLSAHNALNATVVSLKLQLDKTLSKLEDIQKEVATVSSKPDGLAEVKATLGQLGSRVEELSATIVSVKDSFDKFQQAHSTASSETVAISTEKPKK